MRALAFLLPFVAASAAAQVSGPPAGGPTGQFLGPPSGSANDFLGVWALTWDGPIDAGCPCHGSLTISVDVNGGLEGTWKTNGPAATLRGPLGYDQNVWIGQFAQSGDVDFPQRGHFRLEYRDERTLTGSYQLDGTAIPFRWSGARP